MRQLTKLEPFIFYTLLLMLLVPVWSVEFFVTGDGPCHLYNSKVLIDLFNNVYPEFYKPYYFIHSTFEPNWFFNLMTVPLLELFGVQLAEKVFFTFYVLAFGLGFRALINELNPNALFLSVVGLLFCYHKLLMTGFLNNSVSFALWFWVAAAWYRNRNLFHPAWFVALGLLILLLYSAHPMGLVYGLVMIGTLIIGLFYYEYRNIGWKESKDLFLKRAAGTFISALPAIVLILDFMIKHDWRYGAPPPLKDTLQNVAILNSLVSVHSTEIDLAKATAILCYLIFIGAIVLRLREKKLQPTDGLLLFILFVVYNLVSPSTGMTGGLDVSFRMAMIPFVALLFWAATAQFPVWSQLVVQLTSIILLTGFTFARLPVLKHSSDYAAEIYTCNDLIQDTSTLFVLNYDWAGQRLDGQPIANRAWLFNHVDCYLGADKSIVISDNYEAHFSYFPTHDRWQTSFYLQTDIDEIYFDNRPPRADILGYKRRSGGQEIDYVLMLSYRDEFKDHEYTKEIFAQLDQAYEKIFTSPNSRAILYKQKPVVQ